MDTDSDELSDIIEKEGGSILRTFSVSKSSGVLLAVLLVLLVIVFIYAFLGITISWTLTVLVIGALGLFVFNEYRYLIMPKFGMTRRAPMRMGGPVAMPAGVAVSS